MLQPKMVQIPTGNVVVVITLDYRESKADRINAEILLLNHVDSFR